MKKLKFVYLIHAHPLEKLGPVKVFPPAAFYALAKHIMVIQGCVGGGANKVQVINADTESARRAGSGALYTAFGETAITVSPKDNLSELLRVVEEETSLAVIVCELSQLSALALEICEREGISPPDFSTRVFPDGGMVEIDLEDKETHISSGS